MNLGRAHAMTGCALLALGAVGTTPVAAMPGPAPAAAAARPDGGRCMMMLHDDSYTTPSWQVGTWPPIHLIVEVPGFLGNDPQTCGGTAEIVPSAHNGYLASDGDTLYGAFNYLPFEGFAGQETFTYKVTAPDGVTVGYANVTIYVIAYPCTIMTVPDEYYVFPDDTTLALLAPGVLGNDPQTCGAAPVIDALPRHGTARLAPDGSLTYAPNPDFVGDDAFTYRLGDHVTPVTIHVDRGTGR